MNNYFLYILVGFIILWIPYGIVCFYRTFFYGYEIDELYVAIPYFLSKLTLLWPSLITILLNDDIKKGIIHHRVYSFEARILPLFAANNL